MTYAEAVSLLVELSGWRREEVRNDGEGAAWAACNLIQRLGKQVADGKAKT